jgi:hypothetical protein
MLRSRTVLLLSGGLVLGMLWLWGQGVFSAVSTPPQPVQAATHDNNDDQRPKVGTPVAQPSTLLVNKVTLLTVTSRITTSPGNAVVPASVKLERVDAKGTMVANLGTMYDDGTHGDAVAGNGIFTVPPARRGRAAHSTAERGAARLWLVLDMRLRAG